MNFAVNTIRFGKLHGDGAFNVVHIPQPQTEKPRYRVTAATSAMQTPIRVARLDSSGHTALILTSLSPNEVGAGVEPSALEGWLA